MDHSGSSLNRVPPAVGNKVLPVVLKRLPATTTKKRSRYLIPDHRWRRTEQKWQPTVSLSCLLGVFWLISSGVSGRFQLFWLFMMEADFPCSPSTSPHWRNAQGASVVKWLYKKKSPARLMILFYTFMLHCRTGSLIRLWLHICYLSNVSPISSFWECYPQIVKMYFVILAVIIAPVYWMK